MNEHKFVITSYAELEVGDFGLTPAHAGNKGFAIAEFRASHIVLCKVEVNFSIKIYFQNNMSSQTPKTLFKFLP